MLDLIHILNEWTDWLWNIRERGVKGNVVLFVIWNLYFSYCGKIHNNINFPILATLKCTVCWHQVYSHCCAVTTITHLLNLFIIPNWNSVCIYYILLIYSSLVNIWAFSTFSAIVNNAAMNIGVQWSVWDVFFPESSYPRCSQAMKYIS